MNEFFRRLAQQSADLIASPLAFVISVVSVVLWALCGPAFHYSDTWQLVLNTGTSIVTFLAVFLIQNAQNRDAKALHLKLDELIRGVTGARNTLIHLEDLSDDQLATLQAEFQKVRDDGHTPAAESPPRRQARSPSDRKFSDDG